MICVRLKAKRSDEDCCFPIVFSHAKKHLSSRGNSFERIGQAANAAAGSRDIMAGTGHRSETVMRGCIQDAGLGTSAAVKAAFWED